MGDQLTSYRRTPERAPRSEPGRLPPRRRLVVIGVALGLLAVLTVAIVLVSGDDDDTATDATTTTAASGPSTPVTGGRAPDEVVAAQVLPATLGDGWVEVGREPDPVPAEVDDSDPCASAGQPIQRGLLVRATFDHLGADAVVEKAALVAGVVEEGTDVPDLEDQAVIDCLQAGLQPEVAEANEVVHVEQPLPPAPEGSELSGARFEVRDDAGEAVGRFDLVLLQRDRTVAFALVAVLDVAQAISLEDLVAALDGPLAAAAPRLN